MRKLKKLFTRLFPALCAVALTACGMPRAAATAEVTIVENSGTVLLVVVDGQGAGSAMTVGTDHPIYDKDGEEITADALQPGMQLEVGFDGMILETFPAHFSGCEYLKVTGVENDIAGIMAELEEILPKPENVDPMPVLQVECMGKTVTSCLNAPRGTSSWIDGDEATLMDSPHPLQWAEEKMTAVSAPEGCKKFRLILSKEPEDLTVRRWSLEDIGDTSAEAELLTPDGENSLPLEPGIYEVEAGYTEGTLSWAFMVE